MKNRIVSRRTVLSGLAAAAAVRALGKEASPRMLICGGAVVYDAALTGPAREPRWAEVREWRAESSTGLPASYVGLFQTTDDCKPIDDGSHVLVTSSGGAVAIFERESGKTKFYAKVANAHSACMLPGGHVAVASSVNASGNAVVLFHRSASEREVFRTPLESGHGVVWDEERKVLYALGMDRLNEYAFDPENASAPLVLNTQTALPSRGGHELSPARSNGEMIVSTEHGVYVFDKQARKFAEFPVIGKLENVKCVSLHAESGRIAYVKADEGKGIWWTFDLRFLQPEGSIHSPGEKIYKVRWA